MEDKVPPKKRVFKSRAKPKQMEAVNVNMLSSQDEKTKPRPKRKPTAKTAVNILSEAPEDAPKPRPKRAPKPKAETVNINMLSIPEGQEAPKPKQRTRAKPKQKPKQTEPVNILSVDDTPQEEPKKKVVKSRVKPTPKTAVNVPEGEFIEKAKLKQLMDASKIYDKAIKSLTK